MSEKKETKRPPNWAHLVAGGYGINKILSVMDEKKWISMKI